MESYILRLLCQEGSLRPSQIRGKLPLSYKKRYGYSTRSLDVILTRNLKKLLADDLIVRNEPKRNVVFYSLTSRGRKRAETEAVLIRVDNRIVNNFLRDLAESSIEIGQRNPLTGQVAFLVSTDMPICSIAHFPSKSQYQKLSPFLEPEAHRKRERLGTLINRLIEFYIGEKESQVYANYDPHRESVFIMKFPSKKMAETLRKAIERGLFSEYWHIIAMLNPMIEKTWLLIWKKLDEDEDFREGNAVSIVFNFVSYDPQTKEIRKPSQKLKEKFLCKLKATPPDDIKKWVLTAAQASA